MVAGRAAARRARAAVGSRGVQGRPLRRAGRGLAARRAAGRRAARHARRRFLRRGRRQDLGIGRRDGQSRQARRLRLRPAGSNAPASGCAAPGSAMSSAGRCRASATRGSSATPRASTGCWSTRPASASAPGGATPTPNGARAPTTSPSWPMRQHQILRSAARLVSPAAGSSTSPARCCARRTRRRPKPFSPPRPILPCCSAARAWDEAIGGAFPGGEDYLFLTPARHGTDGFFVALFERRPRAQARLRASELLARMTAGTSNAEVTSGVQRQDRSGTIATANCMTKAS